MCVPSPGNAEPHGHKGASWHVSCGRSTLGPESRLGGGVPRRASLIQEHFSSPWRRELACTSPRWIGGEGGGPQVLSHLEGKGMKEELGFQGLEPVAQVTVFFPSEHFWGMVAY